LGAFQLATSRQSHNPVRVQQWNASIRAGDDFILALTVYQDDVGTLAVLDDACARLSLFAETPHGWGDGDGCGYGYGYGYGYGWDYGWDWPVSSRMPVAVIVGVAVPGAVGQFGFFMPGFATARLHGRCRFVLEVDNDDGRFSQVEGIIQVRGGHALGTTYFGLPIVRPVPLAFIIQGKPAAGQVYNLVMADAMTLPANFAGTVVFASTPATAAAPFTVKQISGVTTTVIGGITVAAGAHRACTLSAQPASVFAAGDVLQLVAPAQDATLADIGITLLATRAA
jgi:hypothetical protein